MEIIKTHLVMSSSGRPEDAKLGYGITAGSRCIWALPYLNDKGTENVTTWWGNSPNYNPSPMLVILPGHGSLYLREFQR